MSFPYANTKEWERLEALYAYELLDSGLDPAFDELVELAAAIAGTPISLISLVDADRQWFKAKKGIALQETSREVSFCQYTLNNALEEPLIIPDTLEDSRFENNDLVSKDDGFRFYAGFPLQSTEGYNLGALCVVDIKPHQLSPLQLSKLHMVQKQAQRVIELHKVQAQLNRQQKQMEQLLANNRKLVSILAHETRRPLYSMKLTLNTISQQDFCPEQAEYLRGLMARQVDATCSMLDSLVKWGEIQLNTVAEQATRYNASLLAKTIVDQYAPTAATKNITIINHLPDSIKVPLHKEALAFILRNLLHNALKFTEAGTITLSGKILNGQVSFSVADTGIGMDAVKVNRFMGKKLASTTGTRNETGNGLGLMLVYDFIKQAGGTIDICSQVGKGTSVNITLPYTCAAAEDMQALPQFLTDDLFLENA